MLRRPRFSTALAVVPAIALALGAAPAGAQPELPRFELVPRVGALASLVDLGKSRDSETLLQAKVKVAVAFTAGFTAQYNPRYLPVSFRAVVDYTPLNARSEAQLLACELITDPLCKVVGVDTRYWVAAADVLIRAGEPGRSNFYLLLGVGIKRYDFGQLLCAVDDLVCELLEKFTQDQTNPTVHLGLGFSFRIGPAHLEAELADYMSTHRPEGEDVTGHVQQDLLLTLGVRLTIL